MGISPIVKGVQETFPLEFDANRYTIQSFTFENKEYKVRAFENIIYVANPIDTAYQKMNIYIPEGYFHNESINGYSIESAPIFFPNGIGGYMPAQPKTLNDAGKRDIFGQLPGGNTHRTPPPLAGNMKEGSAIHYALSKGYIVASAGARGRSLKNADGIFTGKAPAGLVDLKAAVCYLRYNDKKIPGNKERIISNGTSAGGAMSLLLGATGDNLDYKPYLEEIGAANVPDHIFAVSAYCPITDLDHADCAYEWQFNGINTYEAQMMDMISGITPNKTTSDQLSEKQIEVSNQLKVQFPIYLNSLNIKDEKGNTLLLDEQGFGNFRDYVGSYVIQAAQKALDAGKDLSNVSWLTIQNGKVTGLDFEGCIRNMKRMKSPPAFDTFDLSAPENHLFGTEAINAQHFTEYSYKNDPTKGPLAAETIIKMMNPLYYIGTPNTNTSQFWHIRYGTIDNNTSFAIEVIVATLLKNKGYEVDFELAWNRPHMGDYDLGELFDWMDKVCK